MGIIVQRQVEAVLSGVLFTVSPTDPQQMLVEYCGGMGEALVSGAVNPGRVAIDRPADRPAEAGRLTATASTMGAPGGAGRCAGCGGGPAERRQDRRACGSRTRHRSGVRLPAGHRVDDRRRWKAVDRPVSPDYDPRIQCRPDPGAHGPTHLLLVQRQRQRELPAADFAAPLFDRARRLLPLLPQSGQRLRHF